jgi:hypothetical protein
VTEKELTELADALISASTLDERDKEYPILTKNRWRTIRRREKLFTADYLDLLAHDCYQDMSKPHRPPSGARRTVAPSRDIVVHWKDSARCWKAQRG